MIVALIVWNFLSFFIFNFCPYVAPNTDRYSSSCHRWVCLTNKFWKPTVLWVYIQQVLCIQKQTVLTLLFYWRMKYEFKPNRRGETGGSEQSRCPVFPVWAPGCGFPQISRLLESEPLTVSTVKLVSPHRSSSHLSVQQAMRTSLLRMSYFPLSAFSLFFFLNRCYFKGPRLGLWRPLSIYFN